MHRAGMIAGQRGDLHSLVPAPQHRVIGRRRISKFIESLVRPHVLQDELLAAYEEMAHDEVREAEALDWAESTVTDVADETR